MPNFLKSLSIKGVEVDTAGASSGQVLSYNGTKFVPATVSGTGGAMNYAQTLGTKQSTISSSGVTIVSTSITTNGYPVQIVATGDGENNGAGAWVKLQLYRGSTAIGNIIHLEGSAGSENIPYALNVIDTPSAGTYTYSLKTASAVAGGSFTFGETDGPVITAVELSGAKGDTGATGATGASGATTLDGLTDVTAPSPASGDFLKWNGTAWVNDAIDLATDTTGNYVSSLVAGTGITLTNNSGEAATPTIAIDTSATLPSGSIQMYGGTSSPTGWFLCDGSEKDISSYGALYAVLGTNFGSLTNGSGGAGTTHFRLPDMRSRMPIGVGTGTGLTARSIGDTGGAQTVTISSGNLPVHTHTLSAHTHTSAAHSHTLGGHTHTGPLHAHNIPRSLIATAGTNRAVVSSTSNQPTLNVQDSGTAPTGAPSSDATNSVTPAATGAPSSDVTGDGGFANSALAIMNPFLAVNFIIKT